MNVTPTKRSFQNLLNSICRVCMLWTWMLLYYLLSTLSLHIFQYCFKLSWLQTSSSVMYYYAPTSSLKHFHWIWINSSYIRIFLFIIISFKVMSSILLKCLNLMYTKLWRTISTDKRLYAQTHQYYDFVMKVKVIMNFYL